MIDFTEEFVNELEIFRKEIRSGTDFFYTYLTIKTIIGKNKKALKILNKTPLFWKINLEALRTASFIVLGRIFDQRSKHNIDKLLGKAQQHKEIFSKISLRNRKQQNNAIEPDWIQEYIKSAYEPTAKDFRKLRKYIKKYRKIYENNYRPIRNQIFAHKNLSNKSEIRELYSKTRVDEFQKIFIFLNKIYKSLWELLYNGRKPVLRPMRYSVIQIINNRQPEGNNIDAHEKTVGRTHDFIKNIILKT